MTFYIGQTFSNEYPPQAAVWCNKNNAHIEKNGSIYTIVANPKYVPTKADLTKFVSEEANKISYGGITIIADEKEFLFKTTPENLTRCSAVMPYYEQLDDTAVVYWEVWQEDLIYMLPVSKVQFKNGYAFGVQMTIQVQGILGVICNEINNLTDEQLANEEFINSFKENAVIQLNSVNTVFDLTQINNAGE